MLEAVWRKFRLFEALIDGRGTTGPVQLAGQRVERVGPRRREVVGVHTV